MRFTLLAAAASLMSACVVYAQTATAAYPTVPNANTKWKAGAAVTVEWKLTDPNNKAPMAVRLYHGEAIHMTEDAVLGTGAAGATSLKVTIPATLKSDWYSVRVGEDDAYSHYFLITGEGVAPAAPPTPGNATQPTATNGAATSPVARPTTSGSAAASGTPSSTNKATASSTPTGAAGALKAGSLAMGAAAVVAAALAF